MKEMPLIIFTLSMQAAVGAVLWATFLRLRDKEAPAYQTNTLCALILSAVGIIASLLHLGKPFLALTSMSNFMGVLAEQGNFLQRRLLCAVGGLLVAGTVP